MMIHQAFEGPDDVSMTIQNSTLLYEVLEKRDIEMVKQWTHIRYQNAVNKAKAFEKASKSVLDIKRSSGTKRNSLLLYICRNCQRQVLRVIWNYDLQIKPKVFHSIVIRNSLNDLLQRLHICRIFAILNPSTDQLTHDSSEVLMSGVG